MLRFVLDRVEERRNVKLATGLIRPKGYVLIAKARSMREPRTGDPKNVTINPFSLGALKYFDHVTGISYRVTPPADGYPPLVSKRLQEFPEELDSERTYSEGAVRRIRVNAYERDPAARRACIEHHGCACSVCRFDFRARYGTVGEGFIHVHHIHPLAARGRPQQVNPRTDLAPVCPNCHAMLHREGSVMSISELRVRIARAAKARSGRRSG
jgi:hypothetical protein